MHIQPTACSSLLDDVQAACVMAYELACFAQERGLAAGAQVLREMAESLAAVALDAGPFDPGRVEEPSRG